MPQSSLQGPEAKSIHVLRRPGRVRGKNLFSRASTYGRITKPYTGERVRHILLQGDPYAQGLGYADIGSVSG